MNNVKEGVAGTKDWFEKAVPEPKSKNVHTQMGVHFEEVGEFVDSLSGLTAATESLLLKASDAVHELAQHLKAHDGVIATPDRIEVLDALGDQIVTATGVAHMMKLDIVGALNEVNASNFSKFVNGEPQFDENRKIKKGPFFFKPDLGKFV